jgi:hypothetical protein
MISALKEIIGDSQDYVKSNAMVRNLLASGFPIAIIYIFGYILSASIDIIPEVLLNFKNQWYFFISLLVYFMYSIHAEVIYEEKKEMQAAVFSGLFYWSIGAVGIYNVAFPLT